MLTASVLAFATWTAVRHAGQPLLEFHAFRQTQTALTSFWIMEEGPRLAYQTPVSGYPWSIPFEFPLYQMIAAAVATAGHLELDAVGRLLSFAFLVACAWPAAAVVERLKLPKSTAWSFCALLWSSPLYLFWGRSFMIETASVFFAFASVPFALDLVRGPATWRSAWICASFGTLAALQKVTTGAPVSLVMGVLWLWTRWKAGGIRQSGREGLLQIAAALVLPILVAGAWMAYAGALTMENPMGAELAGRLRGWTFGTLAQRFSVADWASLLWHRTIAQNAGGFLGVALIAGSLALPGPVRIRAAVLTGLALFLAPLLVFTNLHFVHAYYQAGCVLFLIGSLALAAVRLQAVVPHSAVVPGITALLVASNIMEFRKSYGPMLRTRLDTAHNCTLAVAAVLRENTAPATGIVVFGQDWSSETPYYARRRSFAVPDWFSRYDPVWAEPAKFLGDTPLGAVVVFPGSRGMDPAQIARKLADNPGWRLMEVQGCRILLMH
jgi:hypothetical protein